MASRIETGGLPYGIGRFDAKWVLGFLTLLALVGLGSYAYSRQLFEGEVVTGMRDVGTMGGAPWGLYIAFELYAVGVGFGAMLLVGATRLMGLKPLQPLVRALGVITVVSLVVGYLAVIADLGQPLRAFLNIARYARPMSPFFGTFTVGLVTAMLATLVYMYLDARKDASVLARRPTAWRRWLRALSFGYEDTEDERKRHRHTSLVLAVIIVAVAVAAASSSGFVFSVQNARPGWHSALQAPAFLVLAAATGTATLIIVASILRLVLHERERVDMRMFGWLSNLLTGLTLVYLYFLLAELISAGYSGSEQEARVTESLLTGRYAWIYWLSGALFLVTFLVGAYQALTRRHSLAFIVLAALAVSLAAFGKRVLVVVPSLTHGNLLPYEVGGYSPTWVEYLVVLGLVSLAILIFVSFMKVFPILEVPEDRDDPEGA